MMYMLSDYRVCKKELLLYIDYSNYIGLSFGKFIDNKEDFAIVNKKFQEIVDVVKDIIYIIDGAQQK